MSQAKSNKPQTQTTTITLTLPSTASGMKRSGEGTLLIQRGDLGHLQQIRYGSFQELGLIIQKAEATLIGLEIEPPQLPTPPTNTPTGGDDTPEDAEEEASPEEDPEVDESAETLAESEIEVEVATPSPTLEADDSQEDGSLVEASAKTPTPTPSKPTLPPRQPKVSSSAANPQLSLF